MPSDISQLAECNRQIRTMKLRRRSIKIRTPHGGETGNTHVPSTESKKKEDGFTILTSFTEYLVAEKLQFGLFRVSRQGKYVFDASCFSFHIKIRGFCTYTRFYITVRFQVF